MNALDRLSRANTPHPSATPPPSPEGEGLTSFRVFLKFGAACGDYHISTLHSSIFTLTILLL
ncbi:MAG: hypothetical protein ACI4RP_05210 [Acutalibacteraceae bacterium]